MANASNVSFGKPKATGGVYVAPKGTALPTDATTSLAQSYVNLGYVSEDGLVNSVETDVSDVYAWGGDNVLSDQTRFKETFTVNLLETSADALAVYYGEDNVIIDGDEITVKQSSKPLEEMVVVFEVVLTGGRIKRIVVPHAKISDRSGEITYTDGDAITYPAQFVAFPDEDGNTHTEYIALTSES